MKSESKRKEWAIRFQSLEEKNRAKEIILENGGEVTNAYQNGLFYCLWYLADDKKDAIITRVLEAEELI